MGLVPFFPGDSMKVAAGTSNVTTALPAKPPKNRTLHVANTHGTNIIYIKFGDSTAVATDSELAILAFESMIFSLPDSITHIAILASGASTQVNVTVGTGGISN
jgi:hypothetical protein